MPKKSPQTGKSSARLPRQNQAIHLDAVASEYLKELITFSRVANQGYAICICNTPKFREDLISKLTEKLEQDGIGVYQVKLAPREQSLGKRIRILLESKNFLQFRNTHQKVLLSITGLDDTIQDDEREFDKEAVEKRFDIFLESMGLTKLEED